MAQYQWTGRTSSGAELSASIEAASKEAALAALRAQGITVATLTERTRSAGGRIGRAAFGLLLLAGAAILALTATGTRIRCVRTAAAYDCTMVTTMAGLRPMVEEELRGVSAASEESKTTGSYDSRNRRNSSITRHRLVLTGERSLSSEWMAHPFATTASVAATLNANFARRDAASFETWQVESPPMIIGAVIALIGALVLVSAFRRS